MAAAEFLRATMCSKFRGCMVGALVGDCLGFPFESECDLRAIPKKTLNNFLNSLMSGETDKILQCTDDTCMTLSVASSLIENGDIVPKDIAKKFVNGYYDDQLPRSYGSHVVQVFRALRQTNFEDVFLPATRQFNGSGSFGNGAAMRTAPIALFGNNKGEQYVMKAAEECACITHTHRNGINGAILQSLAVNAALVLDSSQNLDPLKFINNLLEKMDKIGAKPYCESLKKIQDIYVQNKEDISSRGIGECLGNDVTALGSVPTAIYSFLRGLKPLNDYESSNPFLRTLYFAISVGGDTDTIASMAGSIAGAYYGFDAIPEVLQKRCEKIGEVIEVADKLFDVTQETKSF